MKNSFLKIYRVIKKKLQNYKIYWNNLSNIFDYENYRQFNTFLYLQQKIYPTFNLNF